MGELAFFILTMLNVAVPVLIAIALPVILLVFMVSLYRSPVAGAYSVLTFFLIETWMVFTFALNLGLTVYPQDLLFVPLAVVTFFRLLRPGAIRYLPLSLWLLAAMMGFSFVAGLIAHGKSAGVEFRNEFYLLTSIFYFSSFDWSKEQVGRFVSGLYVTAMLIVAIVCFRWLADAFDLDWFDPLWRIAARETGVPLRVVDAQIALQLGLALILMVYSMAAGVALGGWLLMVPPLLIAILLLQHRSVWVAAYLPALMAFVISGKNKERLIARMTAIAAVTAVVVVPLVATGNFSAATSSVTDLAQKATSTTKGTFVHRVEGWDVLIHDFVTAGPRVWLMGSSYGSGYARDIGPNGSEISTAPHNYYVQLLLRTGAIGLLAYVFLFFHLFKGAIRLGPQPYPQLNGYAILGLLTAILLFDIPYSTTVLCGVLVGLFLSLQRLPAETDRKANSVRVQPRSRGSMRISLRPPIRGIHENTGGTAYLP